MEFATWLENQLSRYNLTVYQLSRRSGVHQSTIANWLNGAKPQQNKASAVKAAIKEIAQEQEELIDRKNRIQTQPKTMKKPRPCRTRLCAWRGIMINWTTGAVRPCAT